MFIRGLPLITAIVPFLGINIAYWIGVEYGNLSMAAPQSVRRAVIRPATDCSGRSCCRIRHGSC
jgi:hypothetical protein